jgi:PST family polysaccharide transporter
MGTDFFPRLSAVAEKKETVERLVNEQSYIVLIIAVPVIITMLLLSEFALSVLYSSKFINAGTLLQWQVSGTFLKILGWPVSFILLAKNKGLLFLISEVLFYIVYLAAFYLLFPQYGLDAAGMGYLAAYIVYLPAVYLIGRNISGFSWNKEVAVMVIISFLLICAAFFISRQTGGAGKWLSGLPVLFISLIYSSFKLKKVFSPEDLKNRFGKK